jgi:4-amino-4-deoxy-L-arabinose transferase-like glycosyltransferase
MGLRLADAADSGAVSFHGGRIVMVLDAGGWRGTLRLERDGRQTQAAELPEYPARDERFIVQDPASAHAAVIFLVAVVLVSGAAWRLAPVGPGRSGAAWLLFSLITLHLVFWLSQAVGTTNDSTGYLDASSVILREGKPAYFPPGYPVFLGAMGTFAGQRLGAVVTLLQHVMSVVTALWAYRLLRRVAAEELALVGGLLAGGLPPVLAMSQSVMTEIPTVFAMVGALYFAVRSMETGRISFALLSGLVAGFGGILRVVPLVGLFPAIALLHLVQGAPRRMRQLGLIGGATAVVLLLPLAWFGIHSGKLKLADSSGFHLYNRVVNEQGLVDETGPATRLLLGRLGGDDPRGFPHWVLREHPGMADMEYGDAERLLHQVSIEGIRKDFWRYLAYTPVLAWRDLRAKPSLQAWPGTSMADQRLESPMPFAPNAAALRWRWRMDAITGSAWPILCWTAVVGALLGLLTLHRRMVLALVVTSTGYLLATASLERFTARYGFLLLPFVVFLSLMVPASLLSVWRRSHQRHVPEPAR